MDDVQNAPWVRKHDLPRDATTAPRIVYPESLKDLIELLRTAPPDEPMHAAGSHWGLSTAAMSDHTFVETRDPTGRHPAMARTLTEVIPGCMSFAYREQMARRHPPAFEDNVDDDTPYFVHIETGKRVYELYAELDQDAMDDPHGLARELSDDFDTPDYGGPWAFRTLGSAGGQTVFGALTTGTHGGDYADPPIADDVVALHLVVAGGKHYWIEPEPAEKEPPLTDEYALRQRYGVPYYGGAGNFKVIRDTTLFRAVLIGAHRFGVVYSVVLKARRQYLMHETRVLGTWQDARSHIADFGGWLYTVPKDNKFLQVVVCLTPYDGFNHNLAGITKRSNARWDPTTGPPRGREWRVGTLQPQPDPLTGNPVFDRAGRSVPIDPDDTDPRKRGAGGFLERACAEANFLEGIVDEVMHELEEFASDPSHIGPTIAVVAAAGGTGLAALAVPLLAIVALLALLLQDLLTSGDERFGQTMERIKDKLLSPTDPAERAAGLFAWHMIVFKAFASQQGPIDHTAISYAVMDTHDYLDLSCNVNVDSIEVFFRADDPMLLAFIDALIAFEVRQEWQGKAIVGYASLRFLGRSSALLGTARWRRTCVVEVAGLRDVDGTSDLIDYALMLARKPAFGGVLHWGQRNPSDRADIERRFGDAGDPHNGDLGRWRESLAQLTGDSTAFSSDFTRQTGLEP